MKHVHRIMALSASRFVYLVGEISLIWDQVQIHRGVVLCPSCILENVARIEEKEVRIRDDIPPMSVRPKTIGCKLGSGAHVCGAIKAKNVLKETGIKQGLVVFSKYKLCILQSVAHAVFRRAIGRSENMLLSFFPYSYIGSLLSDY